MLALFQVGLSLETKLCQKYLLGVFGGGFFGCCSLLFCLGCRFFWWLFLGRVVFSYCSCHHLFGWGFFLAAIFKSGRILSDVPVSTGKKKVDS